MQESLIKRDSPSAMLTESLYALAYDAHRIRRWRIGHPETLREFRHDDLAIFLQDTYRPENLVLAIVGAVDTADALQSGAKVLGRSAEGRFSPGRIAGRSAASDHFRYQRLLGETKQKLLLFHFPAPDTLHPDAAPLMILSALMSDGRSARLYRKLKEELQIANSAWASYEGFDHDGHDDGRGGVRGRRPAAGRKSPAGGNPPDKKTPPDADELERIKTRVETRRLYAQEEVMGVARTLASYETLGDYRLIDTFVQRLRDVTPEDVSAWRGNVSAPARRVPAGISAERNETVPERSQRTKWKRN